ncbi:MAG: ABC transporter permease [Actinomycetaceae bacterium]
MSTTTQDPAARGTAPSSTATRELTLLHARELVRDTRYFWFALFFPFFMLGLFLLVSSLMPDGPEAPDFTPIIVPIAIYLAVTSTALTVTAGPLAGMRAAGLLRLLGTTPVGRTRLVLTHLATRVCMALVQLVVIVGVAVGIGAVDVGRVPALLGVSLLGMAMFLGIGYIVGGLLDSADMATNVGTGIQLVTLFVSGLALPFALMPDAVAAVLEVLPTSFFADLLSSQMSSAEPVHPAWLSVSVVALTAVVAIWIAVRTFRWDQGENR